MIKTAVTRDRLTEGYRRRADRDRDLDYELENISREVDTQLGDPPETE